MEAAVVNDSDGSCSQVFLYRVVRNVVRIVCRLWISNSFNESTCFMFSYDVPVSMQEFGCGSKTTDHRTGTLLTLGIVCWQHWGIILPGELGIVTAIMISCYGVADVVFQKDFMIIFLRLWGDTHSFQRPKLL